MINVTRVKGDFGSLIQEKLNRQAGSLEAVDRTVKEIMEEVKKNGDQALLDYTEKFDHVRLTNLKVTKEEIEAALDNADPEFLSVLQTAKENITAYHEKQLEKSWYSTDGNGIVLGQQITPLKRVGTYVPGGKAAYPSSVLMNVIPAVVAGVSEIVMTAPPRPDGQIDANTLTAAAVAGVTEIYKVGGAQAIAALTYGTETIPPVDKIVGPGNIYVARAKKFAFGQVDIDMIAGPSEICVIADESANPSFVAADLLSQAEHDEMAASVLITDSKKLADKVQKELEKQLNQLERESISRTALQDYGHIFIVENLEDGYELANELAPEHLELMVPNAFEQLAKVRNAGAIFLGPFSPEPLGDYFAGPNHTLPTSGTAKFSSPLGTYDFIKRSSVIYYNEKELEKVKDQIITFAEEEGLTAHANSVRIRFEK
ncbi:MAG: histidinol dehydrogenase [Firmicutes bacterium]|nr:histidinol dehydrogenase [Bacillota bacterium]